ncbi:MAG: hypothetical protein JOZ23_03135 [Mycobacterium sp.]|nr:hypothetical protein [Mycobacterium sp.]
MWCPSASLSVWANAWLAGTAAPDDLLDSLSLWAPQHFVTAYDSVAAGHTGLSWPDLGEASAVALLQTVRTTAGRGRAGEPAISISLPVPGDVHGLPAGTQFQRDALTAGEAVLVAGGPGSAIGLVPEFEYSDAEDTETGGGDTKPRALIWTVYSLPGARPPDHLELAEAEYALRCAVRSAADALGSMRPGFDVPDPRGMVEQLLESTRAHRAPDGAPPRALRVLENAAHVDAILQVSSDLMPIGSQLSEVQIASDALKPLSAVVRSARMAAVAAILRSAWRR